MITLPFNFHTQVADNCESEKKKSNLDMLSNLDSQYHAVHVRVSPGIKASDCISLAVVFTIVMTQCFLVNAEIALRLIFHIKIKWAATCSNGFSLLWMGWQARRAAGEGNASHCQWCVYLTLLQLILLQFSIDIHHCLLTTNAMYID